MKSIMKTYTAIFTGKKEEKESRRKDKLRFLAISDFGKVTADLQQTALAMQQYADLYPIDFVFGVGDNFYPIGVSSAEDSKFRNVWRRIFLDSSPALRVPWRMVLGNHDYMGVAHAQIAYHYHKKLNADGLWYMPGKYYDFSYRHPAANSQPTDSAGVVSNEHATGVEAFVEGEQSYVECDEEEVNLEHMEDMVFESEPISSFEGLSAAAASSSSDSDSEKEGEDSAEVKGCQDEVEEEAEEEMLVDFFVLDTNACQDHVTISHPNLIAELKRYLPQLRKKLLASKARWKVVVGHHPLYTKGSGHGNCGKILRDSPSNGSKVGWRGNCEKFGLEEILVEGKVDLYLAGHEHVFQHHVAHGVHHICCGASGAEIRKGDGLYLRGNPNQDIDWVGGAADCGFVAAEVSREQLQLNFVSHRNINHSYRTVIIEKS